MDMVNFILTDWHEQFIDCFSISYKKNDLTKKINEYTIDFAVDYFKGVRTAYLAFGFEQSTDHLNHYNVTRCLLKIISWLSSTNFCLPNHKKVLFLLDEKSTIEDLHVLTRNKEIVDLRNYRDFYFSQLVFLMKNIITYAMPNLLSEFSSDFFCPVTSLLNSIKKNSSTYSIKLKLHLIYIILSYDSDEYKKESLLNENNPAASVEEKNN